MRTMSAGRFLSAGIVLALSLNGQALNTLYSFGRNELGYQPEAGVTVSPGGELFGTTNFGGISGLGVVYELAPPAMAGGPWTYTPIHSFNPQNGEAEAPAGTVPAIGPGGLLYGVTVSGVQDDGVVYRLAPAPSGDGPWHQNTLLAFTGTPSTAPGGDEPDCTLSIGPQGTLYGTATLGGAFSNGVVFRLMPPSMQGGTWTEQVLYSFDWAAGDGEAPRGPLASGTGGAIYGVTQYGGISFGTVFQLLPPQSQGGLWTESLLHVFTGGSDSSYPNGVILGPGGVLYGTVAGVTHLETASASGTVFQLTPPGTPGGAWTETILHSFAGGTRNPDGSVPDSAPVLGPNGELYGTTYAGGTHGVGTIYELVPPSVPGGEWTEVILYNFTDGPDGGEPNAVAFGPDGNLYGTTLIGGVSPDGSKNLGTIFQFVLPQNGVRR